VRKAGAFSILSCAQGWIAQSAAAIIAAAKLVSKTTYFANIISA
jgi:hypothetical protein